MAISRRNFLKTTLAAGAALGALLCILHGRKQLGGMSGDISGLAVTVGEFCGLLLLALL